MTPSELKFHVENNGTDSYYFTRDTMRFFGDTMRNYGVRSAEINGQPVWELYRKKPVKHGNQASAYFSKIDFCRVFPR